MRRLFHVLVLGLMVVGLNGCFSHSSGGGGGGAEAAFSIGGAIVNCGEEAVPGTTVLVFDEDGNPLPQYTTTSTGVGRWGIDLPPGTYELEFVPPADSDLPPLHYQDVVVGDGFTPFPTVFLPPKIASLIINNDDDAQQGPLTFVDDQGNDPLPGLSIVVPANTRILREDGSEVDSTDDAEPLTPGIQIQLELALVAPDQVPMPQFNAQDKPLTNAVLFSLQPPGYRFVDAGGATQLIQVTYPNVNSLKPGTQVALLRFDHDVFDWVSAGTGTVSPDGMLVTPNPGAGLPETGWNSPPGPPPPTTTLTGRILQSGEPLAEPDLVVVTNNGQFAFTDENGEYSIPNVPIPGGNAPLTCTVFTNLDLEFEVGVLDVAPMFPTTTCDIDIAGAPVDATSPEVTDSEPVDGATDVATNEAIVIFFDELMDVLTLPDAITVDDGGLLPVEGEFAFQDTSDSGFVGVVPATVAFFVPDDPLPASTQVTVTVDTTARDLNGNPLDNDIVFDFTTGTDPNLEPEVFSIAPGRGRAGDTVKIQGKNLTGVSVTLAGQAIVPTIATDKKIEFIVPAILNEGPGLKAVVVSDGLGFVQSLNFTLRPRITAITPSSGIASTPGNLNSGTLITIKGSNFQTNGLNQTIRFAGGIDAIFMDDPAETGNAQEIKVFVPNKAVTGAMRVIITPQIRSNPFLFTVVPPIDLVGPQFVSSNPADGATSVRTDSTILVTMNEPVATDSRLRVEVPLPAPMTGLEGLTGLTLVTASPDGIFGLLEFVPESLLPPSSDVFVSGNGNLIADLSGNGARPFSFDFETGTGAAGTESNLSEGKDALQVGDLQDALTLLDAVIDDPDATDEQVDEATFYKSLVVLSLAFDTEGTGADAQALHDLLAGFGFPPAGPDLFDLSLFSAPSPLPANSPNCAAVLAYLSQQAIPAMLAADNALSALPANFQSLLEDVATSETTEIDGTDVLAMRTMLNAQLARLHFVVAFGCDLDIDSLVNDDAIKPNTDVLDVDPTFLTLESGTDLVMSRLALQDAIGLFSDLLDSLQAEVDDQADDLVVFSGTSPAEIAQSEAEALAFENDLINVLAATNGPTVLPFGSTTLVIDLNTPFTTLDVRDLLPTLVEDRYLTALAPLPDPTINGVAISATGEQATALLQLLVPFDAIPEGALDTDDATSTDWAAAGIIAPAFLDPTGDADPNADVADVAGLAADITNVFIGQENDFVAPGTNDDRIFFRIDFASGTPDVSMVNTYEFWLVPNVTAAGLPSFFGRIDASGYVITAGDQPGAPEILSAMDSGDLFQAGPNFLEFAIPKSALIDLGGVPDQSEYVFEFEAHAADMSGSGDDVAAPIRLVLDLAQ